MISRLGLKRRMCWRNATRSITWRWPSGPKRRGMGGSQEAGTAGHLKRLTTFAQCSIGHRKAGQLETRPASGRRLVVALVGAWTLNGMAGSAATSFDPGGCATGQV